MKPYYGKRTFSFPTDAPAPTRFGDDPFKLHFKKLSNGTKITASNNRNFQRPKSHSSSSTRSRTTSTARLFSPQEREKLAIETKIHFVSTHRLFWGMLNSWDMAIVVWKQIFGTFKNILDKQVQQLGLILFRVCCFRFSSFLKMSYRSGFELPCSFRY